MAATAKLGKRPRLEGEDYDVPVSDEKFLAQVTTFMKRWGYGDSEFGRLALGDPNFVQELRSGKRSPTLRTVARVLRYMQAVKRDPGKYRNTRLAVPVHIKGL